MNRVAKRYAKALFELAEELKILKKTQADVQTLKETLTENPELTRILANPLLNELEKFRILQKIFSAKFQPLTINFLKLLSHKKRLALLAEVIEAFEQKMLEYNNTIEAQVISAVELSAEQLGQIRQSIQTLTGKKLLLEKQLDPGILGGFVVKVQDVVIDNSIRYQLEKLREKLVAR